MFRAYSMGNAGLLFKDAGFTHMRSQAGLRVCQKNSVFKKSALQLNPGSNLTVFNGNRGFKADDSAV